MGHDVSIDNEASLDQADLDLSGWPVRFMSDDQGTFCRMRLRKVFHDEVPFR
jgi:hypothetical protein